ncbi:unnamed protein product [Paramecium octaurelia]|uniref:Uncharacterized protein n=1 Tax=Paramecium octaurelia TaxID=43137 RepID=A0A8S1W0F3_PAROT|nr:unnamed protein product [Paramecium octaurelia]
MKSKQYVSLNLDSDEYKKQIKLLEEMNEKLTQENCDLIREITQYQIQLGEKDSQIDYLRKENGTLKFELKLALKKEDLYSTVTLDRYKKSFSTIQPQSTSDLFQYRETYI